MSESLTRLRLDLSYDGTDFAGWAKQPGLRTVEGELERAVATVLREPAEAIRFVVAGRTDAGVHARGQVAHLDLTSEQLARWEARFRGGALTDAERATGRARHVNGALGRSAPDIVVRRVTEAPEGFDARFSAVWRRYEYRLSAGRVPGDPLARRFTAHHGHALDLAAMRVASASLLGLRDFTTFCKAREGSTAVRTLLEFEWRVTEDGAYAARLRADAFCHSMVRALVGAVVAVGQGRIGQAELEQLLADRARTGRTPLMAAHGLSLEEIGYPDDAALSARADQTRARRAPLPACGEHLPGT